MTGFPVPESKTIYTSPKLITIFFTLLRQKALWLATGMNGILGFAGFRKDPAFAAKSFASTE